MDIIDIALAKNFAKKMAAGFTNVEVDGMTINFTLIDGSTVSLTVPTPADGVSVTDLEIDENGDLICTMSDGTEINAGKALPQKGVDYFTEEEIEEFKQQVESDINLLVSNYDTKEITIEGTGTIIDAINWYADSTLKGKTSQDTTSISGGDEYDSPSPEHSQPIHNVSGDVKIETNNINFFNSELLAQESNYNTYDKSTGLWTTSSIGSYFRSIFYNASGAGTIKDVSKLVKLQAGNYTVKFFDFSTTSSANNAISILVIDEDGNKISTISSSINNKDTIPITLEEDGYIDITRTGNTGTFTFSNIMFAKGTYTTNTFPSFVERKAKNITFPLSQGQKMYERDYLADDGIHHVRGQVVLDGTEMLTRDRELTNSYRYYTSQIIDQKISSESALCNYLSNAKKASILNTSDNEAFCIVNDKQVAFRFNKNRFADVADVKAWLAQQYANNTPLKIEYELAQEVIDPYTSEQQTAWNELKKLETYKKETHIYTSSDGLAPDSKITYLVNPLSSIEARLDLLEA